MSRFQRYQKKCLAPLFILLLLTASAFAATLPPDIKWETNNDDPPIGDPAALKGGTFITYMEDYPLTFRLYGPNSNDAFASWNRAYTLDFALVSRHPVTDRYIPWMATHWSIQADHRTVYFKLNPEAKWSDGQPVTADDYIFAYEMMGSPYIVDPFNNEYVKTYFESVEKVDDHTLKIVGKKPSWRPLADFNLSPMPRHATKLGPDWVKGTTNTPPLTVGPYRITQMINGQSVTFEKVKDWWGTDKGYFKGMYNVDKIVVRTIPQERVLDYLKNREVDHIYVITARVWTNETNFPTISNGWIHKKRVFVDNPRGLYGIALNLDVPIFQNKDFRKALQYLFNFDLINKNQMANSYFRKVSAFEGTEYENKDLKPYGFDPGKAREHLTRAGYTKRGGDGILVNDKGQRAAFTLIYGSKGLEPHLTIVQQIYKRAGIEMQLKLLEGATSFNRALERKYEAIIISYTGGFYPEPKQYFHSEFKKTTNNNDIWGYGTPETDKLIDIYNFNMDKQARLDAMHKLDAIIQDEAFYIPFWDAPYIRMLYWDQLCWPKFYLPKRTEQITDWQVFWIDPAKKQKLDAAIAANQSLAPDTQVDEDPWNVKAAAGPSGPSVKAGSEVTTK